jgi:hypothetical protein
MIQKIIFNILQVLVVVLLSLLVKGVIDRLKEGHSIDRIADHGDGLSGDRRIEGE